MEDKYLVFEKYIEQYSERLSRLCCNLCRNYADADDLFHDKFSESVNVISCAGVSSSIWIISAGHTKF